MSLIKSIRLRSIKMLRKLQTCGCNVPEDEISSISSRFCSRFMIGLVKKVRTESSEKSLLMFSMSVEVASRVPVEFATCARADA